MANIISMAYVYRHIRKDTNKPFYIGIGNIANYARAYSRSGRNKIWYNIVAKTDFEIEIILDDCSWEEACSKEIEFISFYGRICNGTGVLCNMTDGGEGVCGLSQSARDIIRKSRLGKKLSNQTKAIISQIKKGNTNRGITVVNDGLEISLPNAKVLADLIGESRATVWTWVAGKFKPPIWFDWKYKN